MCIYQIWFRMSFEIVEWYMKECMVSWLKHNCNSLFFFLSYSAMIKNKLLGNPNGKHKEYMIILHQAKWISKQNNNSKL